MAISVVTETTEESATPARGWVLYDGECEFCLGWVRRMKPVLAPRGFAFLPLQTPWVRAYIRLPENELLSEMRAIFRNGKTLGGADALVELAKSVWWAWPLVALAQIPGVRNLLRARYRAIAARRYCINGRCTLPQREDSHNKTTSERGVRI